MPDIKKRLRRLLALLAPDLLTRLHRLLRKRDAALLARIPTDQFLRRQYRESVGRDLDLERPAGLSEKLNALKLRPADPLQTLCADKIRVRDYVAERVGSDILIPLILTAHRLAEINPRTIPQERFVLKTNHDFGGVIICDDRTGFDWTAARVKLAGHLASNHWHRHREPVYRDIKPGILVETFLEAETNNGLEEYKIFCFHGVPHFIMAIREKDGIRTKTIFDRSWRRLPVRRRATPAGEVSLDRPASLEGLLRVAARLAEPFAFCRVDLYENFGDIRFGEITFYPEGGMDIFEPYEWELRFGSLLRLPEDDAPPAAGRGAA